MDHAFKIAKSNLTVSGLSFHILAFEKQTYSVLFEAQLTTILHLLHQATMGWFMRTNFSIQSFVF